MRKKIARIVGIFLLIVAMISFGYAISIEISNFHSMLYFSNQIILNLIVGFIAILVLIFNKSIRRALE